MDKIPPLNRHILKMSFKKLTIFLILLSIFLAVAGFWYYQRNIFSRGVLMLEILAPNEVELLEEIEYIVRYKNVGNIRLEEARLIFEYPEYSLVEGGKLRIEEELGDIYPEEERTISFKARLLGKKGETKTAKAWLSFRPKNIQSRYDSENSHTITITFVPLTFEIDLPSKVEPGKEFRLRLNYFSNVNYPLSDLRAKIEYPPGFEFLESTPSAIGGNEWEIGLLNKTEGGRIEIVGKITGEVKEEKFFRANFGSWQEGEFVLLKEAIRGIEITRPFLYITQQINNNPEYVVSPGDFLHYEIFFKNLGERPQLNLFLVVRLEGDAFDFQSLKTERGKFELGNNSLVWDSRDVPQLRFLDSQEEGKVEFWIELKEQWPISGQRDKNPVVKNRIFLGQARKEFITKVNSKLEILQKGYFKDAAHLFPGTSEPRPEGLEVFGNFGPLPPQVDQTTTYTILWQAKNFYNDLKNVKIKATLPNWVRLTGEIFPKDARLTFDSQSREIIWEIGDLEMGIGVLNEPLTIAFQIALTPTTFQKGKTSTLVGPSTITGEDLWTENIIDDTAKTIDTTLPDDPTVTGQEGIVQ